MSLWTKCFLLKSNYVIFLWCYVVVDLSNCIFSTQGISCIFFYIHEFMSHFSSPKLQCTNVQILHFLCAWQLKNQPKFPLSLSFVGGLNWNPLCVPFVCPCWASVYKEKHGFRASGSSDGLIIHGLSLWIIAHSLLQSLRSFAHQTC